MNIQITDLRALDGDSLVAVHVLILSEDGARDSRVYHILPAQYGALRLRVGEIGCETVDALEAAAMLCGAIRKGMSLLSYGAQSEKNMRQKLRARGFAPEVAAEAAAYLKGQGWMNEAEDALRLAQSCRRKHWGERRILSHLFEKGYSEAAVNEVRDALAEEDFLPDCMALIRSRYHGVPTDRHEQQKVTAALMRYGYSLSEIREAMSRIREEESEE
ncbi:MAG: RecX family transcriptional regulator [Clostridia bacterium]|nr:RecX family transcriptional regulator [Clostridia bacterium]